MRVTIAAVGRLKDGGERELYERYAKRFDQAGRAIAFGPLTLVELPESRQAEADLRKSDEAARLLKAASACDVKIALDEHGQHYTSAVLANRLARLRDDGIAHLSFVIGGPDGHGAEVMKAARFTLALGHLTLPHGLARVILVEQLYRAVTILTGHPYHRE
jgi:23S rRNA (pseudouridine1915-N3)-methyltransferase